MKLHDFLAVALISLSTAAIAQSHEHAQADPQAALAQPTQKSEAQKSFAILKSLSGSWEGSATMDPPMEGTSKAQVALSMRVTSRGNAIVHEMQEANTPLDSTKYDHPVTMVYLDNDRLMLVHYCDAGNRPRMTARSSADGKTVEFDFQDLSGSNQYGHMHHAVFTVVDANHHTEDWTYLMPGDKLMHAHLDLTRKNDGGSSSGK
nr:hypothetical protein Hi04_10k_c962_00031 [uncultured bacterium]